jgi:Domain of unknown function DUF29
MQVLTNNNLRELYEIDDYLWLEETVKLLKEKRFDELDLDNLIEELEALSRRDKAAVASLLEQLIRHLLLLEYWQTEYEYNGHHWRSEVINFRSQLNELLTKNLSNYLDENLDRLYQKSLNFVKEKTKHSVIFPENCPYSLTQLLDEDFLP